MASTAWVVGPGVAVGAGVGKPVVSVGSGEKVPNDGESDGSRMNVGDGLELGVAVGCTKGGRVGELEAKAIWVGSVEAGGWDR